MVRPKSKNFKSNNKNGNKFKKNFKHSKTSVHKKKGGTGEKIGSDYNKDARKHKNYKHIQRSREAEEAFMRQKQVELSYKAKNFRAADYSDDDGPEETVDPFEQLLTTLGTDGKIQGAIESSSEDESEGDDQDVDEEEDELLTEDDDENLGDEQLSPKKLKMDKKLVDESEEDTEEEIDPDLENEELSADKKDTDPFCQQIEFDLSPELLNSISTTPPINGVHELNWPVLGRIQLEIPKDDGVSSRHRLDTKVQKKPLITLDDDESFAPEGTVPKRIDYKNVDLKELFVKVQIEKNVVTANEKSLKNKEYKVFTPIQAEIFSLLNNYQDVYYPQQTLENGEQLRFVYCLHALNHMLKTRQRILHHNARLGKMAGETKKSVIVPDHFRDQGLVRPKVLIVLPFRESAYRVINTLISLLTPEITAGTVINHKRFVDEFTGDSLVFPVKNPKPEDYEQTFAGNTDDTFRIGISLTKKCIKVSNFL